MDAVTWDGVLAEQVAYYRRRAAEYDRTAHSDVTAAQAHIDRVLGRLRPGGRVVELACGTGLWTAPLRRYATELTGVDASPEMLDLARARCGPDVRFVAADLFRWEPDGRYDVVFCAAWLSHVPSDLLPGFLVRAACWLTRDGRLLVVDEPVETTPEQRADPATEIATRTLGDGSAYRIVKVFLEPSRLERLCTGIGLVASTTLDDGWLVADIRAARP